MRHKIFCIKTRQSEVAMFAVLEAVPEPGIYGGKMFMRVIPRHKGFANKVI